MSLNTYEFDVQMGCGGCSSAFEDVLQGVDGECRVMSKARRMLGWFEPFFTKGIEKFDVSLEHKTVSVSAKPELSFEAVLDILKGTGKAVHSGKVNGQARDIWEQ